MGESHLPDGFAGEKFEGDLLMDGGCSGFQGRQQDLHAAAGDQ